MDRGFGPHRHRQRLMGKENGLVAARPNDGLTYHHKSSMPVYAGSLVPVSRWAVPMRVPAKGISHGIRSVHPASADCSCSCSCVAVYLRAVVRRRRAGGGSRPCGPRGAWVGWLRKGHGRPRP